MGVFRDPEREREKVRGGILVDGGGSNRAERCSRNLIVRSAGKRSGFTVKMRLWFGPFNSGVPVGVLFIGNNILRLSRFRAAEHFYSVVSRFISHLYIYIVYYILFAAYPHVADGRKVNSVEEFFSFSKITLFIHLLFYPFLSCKLKRERELLVYIVS